MNSLLKVGQSFQPLVSVIVTTYNYGEFIKQCLNSVRSQDYPLDLIEIIVVDDGSTDNTSEVLSSFGDRIHAIHQENAGQAAAINRAMEIAKGQIIALLDADDEWYPNKLSMVVSQFADEEVGMVHHPMNILENGVVVRRQLGQKLSSGWIGEAALNSQFNRNSTSALTFRREVLERMLPVPETLRTGGADFYFAVLAAFSSKLAAIQQPLALYRIHGANRFTDNLSTQSFREQLMSVEEVHKHAEAMALSLGLKLPKSFDAYLCAEYPMSCRISLAWNEHHYQEIPGLFWQYLWRYALVEYGFSLRFMERTLRMAAGSILPPIAFAKLRSFRRKFVS